MNLFAPLVAVVLAVLGWHEPVPLPLPRPDVAVAVVLPPDTAVYDIAAHKVTLPDGRVLEAHSGRGRGKDNPGLAARENLGPTPPNMYRLTVRAARFHGVRALRLNPLDDDKMHGRDGILAHSYLEHDPGASHGCVAFKDYAAFLAAYQSGAVRFLKVVAFSD